jgi:hypothetical protein
MTEDRKRSTTSRWEAPQGAMTPGFAGSANALLRKTQSKERAMKLTSAQVERTLSQFEAQALPDSHPMVRQLNELFGDHTFFLDGNGLNIVEPADEGSLAGARPARVVNLANWSDARLTKLRPHEPEPTDAVVELGV